ncbi:MAG TPA: penicillin-binding protein 2 [Capsulimonadaceae bacterium]|jgi:stage V sporulation protein D (sporulation-specific penicillin-binding protein)
MSVRTDYASDRMRLHRSIIRRRVRFGFFLVVGAFLLLAAKLAYVQLYKHDYYAAEAEKIRKHRKILLSQRGMILDRRGVPLAINVAVGDIAADPLVIADPAAFAADIAPFLPGQTAEVIAAKITAAKASKTPKGRKVRYVLLGNGVAYEHVTALQKRYDLEKKAQFIKVKKGEINPKKIPFNLSGYSKKIRWVRTYPKGTLACHILGFMTKKPILDKDGKPTDETFDAGEYGIEKSMNAVLAGKDGYVLRETDAQGRDIPGTEVERQDPVDGQNVQLTIDVNIQRYAEEALARSVTDHHAESGSCVVMDPKTGEILAMANMPVFNPNMLKGTSYKQWDNRAVCDLYEPGSTLKSITLAAALDSEGLDVQMRHVHCSGSIQIGNHVVHCAKDPPDYGVHGDEVMRDVLKNSCNIGAAQYALHLGSDKLFAYEQGFGFLERPDLGLPGAQRSHLRSPAEKKWSQIQLANVGFGQGVSVTPVQLTAAYCTFGNNGYRVFPNIIRGLPAKKPVRVIKPEVAKVMLSMLQTVVEDGTGKPAQVEGYNIGGKTGSAQVADNGHYGNEYIGSFCGIVPISDPKFVILCAVNRPQGVHWGAVVAAPVVHDVAQQALWYSGISRDATDKVDYADRKRVPSKPKAEPVTPKARPKHAKPAKHSKTANTD